MNHASKLVLALLLLALLGGLGVFLWLRPAHAPAPVEAQSPEAHGVEAPRSAPASSNEKLAAEAAESERASMPKEAKSSPAAAAAETKQGPGTIVARLVDENLRPIANGFLRAEDVYVRTKDTPPAAEARSGDDGSVTLVWNEPIVPYSVHFAAGARGYGTLFPRGIVKAGETLHLGELTLRPGGAVRGLVVDKDRRPVADAQVVVADDHDPWIAGNLGEMRNRGPSIWEGVPASQSAQDGSFVVDGVAAGMTRAWAKIEGMRWAVSEPIEVPPGGEVRDVVLVLDAEDKADPELRDIEGIVLGPDDKPIAKARVRVHQTSDTSTWSNSSSAEADGRFCVHPEQRGVHIAIDFSDPADHYTGVKLEEVKPGTKDLVVRLQEPRFVTLEVRDERGPVEDFRVRWGTGDWDVRGRVDRNEPHAGGSASLRVPSSGSFWLQVLAPGHKPVKLGPFENEKVPATLAAKLASIPGIRGRVTAGDKPVSGAQLALHEQPRDSEIVMNGFATLVMPEAEIRVTTDEQGLFVLDVQRNGSFSIFVDADGYARAQYGIADFDASKGLRDVVIALDAGGALEGKVLMPPGRSPAGVIVGINRGDARPLTQVVGPDGAFHFEHLTAGDWELKRVEEMFNGPTGTSMSSGKNVQAGRIRRDFVIATGRTANLDLDLRNAIPCVLEIELTNNQQPARAWSIVASPKSRHVFTSPPPSATTDSGGRARIVIEDAGWCSLSITPPAEAASAYSFRTDVQLQPGPNNWSQNLRTGRVEGAISGWRADAGIRWRLALESNQDIVLDLHPDEDGRFVEPLAPADRIGVLRSTGARDGTPWEKTQTFDLGGGATKQLQLP